MHDWLLLTHSWDGFSTVSQIVSLSLSITEIQCRYWLSVNGIGQNWPLNIVIGISVIGISVIGISVNFHVGESLHAIAPSTYADFPEGRVGYMILYKKIS